VTYAAPSDDLRFVLDHLPGWRRSPLFRGFEDTEPGLVEAVLTQAARFAMSASSDIGGQGNASNLAFSLCQNPYQGRGRLI